MLIMHARPGPAKIVTWNPMTLDPPATKKCENAPQRAHHFEVGAADVKELFRQAAYEVASLPSRVSCLKQRCEHIGGCHLLLAGLLHGRLREGACAGVTDALFPTQRTVYCSTKTT